MLRRVSRPILKAVNPAEPEAFKLIEQAWAAMRTETSLQDLVNAINSGDTSSLTTTFNWAEFLDNLRELREKLQTNAYQAGIAAFGDLLDQALLNPETVAAAQLTQSQIAVSFNLIDQNVVDWAKQHAGELIVQITEDVRQSVRDLVTSSVGGVYTPQELAREVYQFIPLHSRFAQAVVNYRDRLFKQFVQQGVEPDVAKARTLKLAEKYADKLTRVRSKVIARTEVMTASAQGTYAGWGQAFQQGLIVPGTRKQWLTAEDERVCPWCGPMDKELVSSWDGAFSNGLITAPAHPNCRCDVILVPPEVPNA